MYRDFVESLFHPVVGFVSRNLLRPLLRNVVYTVRHGPAKGLRTQGGLDFIPRPETLEGAFLFSKDLAGKTVYDVGAFEGLYAIAFARKVGANGCVIAFEPNPANRRHIEKKIAINGIANIRIVPKALGSSSRVATLIAPRGELSMGTLDEARKARFATESRTETSQVEIDTLDHFIETEGLPAPDLVKIDVEGLEMEVLNGMLATLEGCGPDLLIEIHGTDNEDRCRNAGNVIEFLQSRAYLLCHVESGLSLTRENASAAKRGHIWATRKRVTNDPRVA